MGQGNVQAMKRTVDSVKDFCDDFVFGDLCILAEDSVAIAEQDYEVPVTRVMLPFNYIFKHGFSATLNVITQYAKNNIVLYLNVGEIFESCLAPVLDTLDWKYNCYFIDHATDKHRWFRMYDKRIFKWSGLIHEEIVGSEEPAPYHKAILRFADLEKDNDNVFKAKVYGDTKEIVYFEQLMKIADDPSLLSATSYGWHVYAKQEYKSMKDRIARKGVRYDAFVEGDLNKYLNDVFTNPEFEKELFETNAMIEFQGKGQKKYLL